MNSTEIERVQWFIKMFGSMFIIVVAGNIYFVSGLKQYLCNAPSIESEEHEKHKKDGKECWPIERFKMMRSVLWVYVITEMISLFLFKKMHDGLNMEALDIRRPLYAYLTTSFFCLSYTFYLQRHHRTM